MKSAGKARNNGLYRHIRTSKEIIRNLLNDYQKTKQSSLHQMGYPFIAGSIRTFILRGIRIFTLVHICSKKTLRQCLILTAMRL